jgi:manganese transport protein
MSHGIPSSAVGALPVPTGRKGNSPFRPWSFVGPAAMVAVGYMDPGNWATDLEGGAFFGYQLLWVLVASNLMALLLQTLCTRLGIVSRLDLAEACRTYYSPRLAVSLWLLAELAIIACDLGEILGSAIALNLLFHIPMVVGALLTAFDVLLILALQRRGTGTVEIIVFALVVATGICLGIDLAMARPSGIAVVRGFVPSLRGESLYLAIGILGATVMPHNLYLHSALVRPSKGTDARQNKRALRSTFLATLLALNLAFVVNAAILVLSGTVFGERGIGVTDLRDAHQLLGTALGAAAASILFAVGLLCSGQSATITGTLAGQIVMEGFVRVRLSPFLRRLVTRGLAIVPAVTVLATMGEEATTPLLVASQVVLSLQLPFAVVPLVRLTNSPSVMGSAASRPALRILALGCAALVIAADAALLRHLIASWDSDIPLLAHAVTAVSLVAAVLLAYLCWVPLRPRSRRGSLHSRLATGRGSDSLALTRGAPGHWSSSVSR